MDDVGGSGDGSTLYRLPALKVGSSGDVSRVEDLRAREAFSDALGASLE